MRFTVMNRNLLAITNRRVCFLNRLLASNSKFVDLKFKFSELKNRTPWLVLPNEKSTSKKDRREICKILKLSASCSSPMLSQ